MAHEVRRRPQNHAEQHDEAEARHARIDERKSKTRSPEYPLLGRTQRISRSAGWVWMRATALPRSILLRSRLTMRLHHAGVGVEMDVPDMLQQHGARVTICSRMLHEVFEQPELAGQQARSARRRVWRCETANRCRDRHSAMRSPRPNGRPGGPKLPPSPAIPRTRRASPGNHPHRHSLRPRTRSPSTSPRSRQHEYRGRRSAPAHRPDYLETIDPREHAVDDQQIPWLGERDSESIVAIALRGNLVSLLPQRAHYVPCGSRRRLRSREFSLCSQPGYHAPLCLQLCIFLPDPELLA